jgi:hypothetical protein
MEMLEKYDEAAFYVLNKDKFQDFLALREEFCAGNFSKLATILPAMLEAINNLNNQSISSQKQFYDYYSQFSTVKNLKKSQIPKLKLRKNYLHVLERQFKAGDKINYEDFLDFYLHWHCSDFFAEQWFLMYNKYIFFSTDFIKLLIESIPYIQKVLVDLELPSVFLPLDTAIFKPVTLETSDFHQIPTEKAAEMLEQFSQLKIPSPLQIQAQYFKEMLTLAATDKSYLLIKFVDLDLD